MNRTRVTRIIPVLILLTLPVPVLASLEQTPSPSGLDSLCPTSDDYSCKEGQTDKQGKPCGEDLPVASSQVKGICIGGDKAEETSYLNQNGQWQGTPQSTNAADGTSGGGATQVSPAFAPVVTSDQLQPQAGISGIAEQGSSGGLNGSVLQSAMDYLSGGQGATFGAEPSQTDSGQSDAQPSWLTNAQVSLQPADFPQGTDGAAGNPADSQNLYEPNSLVQTLSGPMGSLQNLTSGAIQGDNQLGNTSGSEVNAQDLNAIQTSGSTFAESALYPTSDQNTANPLFTAYGVCNLPEGCNATEGAPTTAWPHPDDNGQPTNQIYTLDCYVSGNCPYVTVAGPADQKLSTGVIPQITYNDPVTGASQTVQNVPYMVADTGGDFPNGSNHYDVPLTMPTSVYGNTQAINSILNSQPFSEQNVSVVPTSNIQQSYAIANPWGSPPQGGLPSFTDQDQGVFPLQETSWEYAALSSYEFLQLLGNGQ